MKAVTQIIYNDTDIDSTIRLHRPGDVAEGNTAASIPITTLSKIIQNPKCPLLVLCHIGDRGHKTAETSLLIHSFHFITFSSPRIFTLWFILWYGSDPESGV